MEPEELFKKQFSSIQKKKRTKPQATNQQTQTKKKTNPTTDRQPNKNIFPKPVANEDFSISQQCVPGWKKTALLTCSSYQ